MTRLSRILMAVAALSLLALYALPLWHISLGAPQYPEGLGMQIRLNTIVGATEHDLTNINNLNHYIGMRAIEPDAIPELRWMPWIVAGLIVFGLGAAIIGRRGLVWGWLGAFAALAVAGLYDFWRWGYDYGNNLDQSVAILKIPDMSYQPPLIGTKQLLNFTATSLPASGAMVAGLAFLLAAAALWHSRRRFTPALGALAIAAACAAGPAPIVYGTDECHHCRMVISDPRFGSRMITATGKTLPFDSIECMASYYLKDLAGGGKPPRALHVTDATQPGTFLAVPDARFIRNGTNSPMGMGFAATTANRTDTDVRAAFGGGVELLTWAQILELVEHRGMRPPAAGHGG